MHLSPPHDKIVEYIVPLCEILAQVFNLKSPAAKQVQATYQQLISTFGDELTILRKIQVNEIEAAGYGRLAQAITNMRAGHVTKDPGYDGVYGTIRVLDASESEQGTQLGMGF